MAKAGQILKAIRRYIKSCATAEINDGFSRYTFDVSHQLKDDLSILY
jgi:hypothetical protein